MKNIKNQKIKKIKILKQNCVLIEIFFSSKSKIW